MAGFFIAFEGPDGAGKSTQLRRLAVTLRQQGWGTIVTREPGGTPVGEAIRDVLLNPDLEIDPLPESLLYLASRAQHVRKVILPALEAGQVVLTGRFAGASIAYQGHGRGLNLEFVEALNRRVTGGLTPDLTLLLNLDPAVGLARVGDLRRNEDRLERADLAFHQRARDGFLAVAASDPSWVVLDALLPEEELALIIWETVREKMSS
ncbi:MAG: dTMP kinase [Truepera sp.]|nr:dTMP kinase [Truepera sp.]